jgi:hypothetical protein
VDPRPNVLADEARPNTLSTQPTGRTPAAPARPAAPRVVPASNQFAIANPSARPLATGDSRFEPRVRRAPSLATIIVVGFLVVTAFRLIGGLVGRLAPDQTSPPVAPAFVEGSSIHQGSIWFGTTTDGLCGIAGVAPGFTSGTDVWWSAHLSRSLETSTEALVVTVARDGVELEEDATSGRDLGANGSSVVCAIKPRDDTTAGQYIVQLWDGAKQQILASGEFRILG